MKYIICLIITLFLTSCNSNKKEEYDEKRALFIKEFVTQVNALHPFEYDKMVFHMDKLINELRIGDESFTGLAYVINSECSVCIGEFLDFMSHLEKITERLPLIAIVEPGTKETLKYYIKQTGLETINLIFRENIVNRYIEGTLEKQNGMIFYIYKDKVINSFVYESLLRAVS